jgi:glyoxylase-like metal-dependent hydrolase (beta-lactamase superfamily II)
LEVAPDIHRIEFPFADRMACCYALVGERVLIVDSGLDATPGEHVLPYLDSLGVDRERIDYLLSTHADLDHTGGNASLLEAAPRTRLLAHELDRAMIEDVDRLFEDRYDGFRDDHGIAESEEVRAWVRDNARHAPVDVVLNGGERLRLAPDWNVDIVHTPGHSRGHVSVLDPRSGAAVIADAALADGIPNLAGDAAMPPTYRYVDPYLGSVALLEQRRPTQLLTAHYPAMDADQALDFLAASRAYVRRVEDTLRELLTETADGATTKELIARAGPRLGAWPEASHGQLVFPLAGHLERLATHGLAVRERHDGTPRWRWVGPRPSGRNA